jgi:hypothetical protein
VNANEAISLVLAMHALKLVTHDGVIAWADAQILACEQPDPLLFDLSLEGPERCRWPPESEFPAKPLPLTYAQAFSAKALSLPLEDDVAVRDFADWAAAKCMGHAPGDAFVQFGYLLDDLIDDPEREPGTVAFLRERLPDLLPECRCLWPHRLDTLRVEG